MIRGTEIGVAVVHETLLLETGSMGLPEVEILHLLRRAPCHSDPLACDNGTVAVEDRQICDADGYWREQAWLLKNSIAVSFGRKRRARMPYKRPSRNRDTFSIIRDCHKLTFSTPTGHFTSDLETGHESKCVPQHAYRV
jgi:hypothetical protein